jgi:hypothetical protein
MKKGKIILNLIAMITTAGSIVAFNMVKKSGHFQVYVRHGSSCNLCMDLFTNMFSTRRATSCMTAANYPKVPGSGRLQNTFYTQNIIGTCHGPVISVTVSE